MNYRETPEELLAQFNVSLPVSATEQMPRNLSALFECDDLGGIISSTVVICACLLWNVLI